MNKVTVKELKQREDNLQEWLTNKDLFLGEWIKSLPKEYSISMDFGVDSLLKLGEYIINRYDTPNAILKTENPKEIDAISFYIGEVFIKNISGDNKWIISDAPVKKEVYNFYFNVDGNFGAFNPFNSCVPNILYSKESDKIYALFQLKKAYVKDKLVEASSDSRIPGKGGFSYQYFILVKDESFELNEVEQALKAYYAKKGSEDRVYFHNERHLLVNMKNDYYFHFQLDTREGVLTESEEIAKNYTGSKDKAIIASCKSRVEFWGDEDSDGDFINDHMYLLEQLIQNDKLLIFDFRNGVFFDE